MQCDNNCAKCPGAIKPEVPTHRKEPILAMILVLTLTGLIAGVCLSFTYAHTKDAIAKAERQTQFTSVAKVLPAYDNEPLVEQCVIGGEEKTVYVGKKNGTITGIALVTEAVGYGGTLKILVGIDMHGAISGMELLSHQETPGLGAKAGGASFLQQFTGKKLSTGKDALMVRKDGGDIDAITAATITSRAVCRAAAEALKMYTEQKNQLLSIDNYKGNNNVNT